MDVLLVHGYSETSLSAYFGLPGRLQAAVPGVGRVALAAFNSLDDTVTVDDLADAMEVRVSTMESSATPPWNTAQSAVICHSTGAIVARRWVLNRLIAGKPLPSHLITMAGANHGSTLALMGKSVLGYVQKLLFNHIMTVGAGVLTDLEYGSDFLLRLNREWLERSNDGSLDRLWTFSMGGDFVGSDPTLQIFWQTHECGSDNTVRISGANLNYTFIDASHDDNGQPVVTCLTPSRPVPHLVLTGYSHFGGASGIVGWVDPAGDRVVAALRDALTVATLAQYQGVQAAWDAQLQTWMTNKRQARGPNDPSQINSTLVFTMRDESGRSIDDCLIAILNQSQLGAAANAAALNPAAAAAHVAAANAVSSAIIAHSPIQNDDECGSYSFYVDYDTYLRTSPHVFHAEAALPTQLVSFLPLTFTQPVTLPRAIAPNECTYVGLTMKRDADQMYAAYGFDAALNLSTTWQPMPFPPDGQIPPPPAG
jgi:hypothetical protein